MKNARRLASQQSPGVFSFLPFFTPAAIPGLFIGCFLSNLLCGAAVMDVVFGSIATLNGD